MWAHCIIPIVLIHVFQICTHKHLRSILPDLTDIKCNFEKSTKITFYRKRSFIVSNLCLNLCVNKNAFQWDAYRPLVDRIPACTVAWGCTCQGGVHTQRRVYLLGVYLPGWCTCQRWSVPVQRVYLHRGCTHPGGCICQRGVYLPRGCTCLGGVPARGCTCRGGVPARGCTWLGGTCLGGVPARGCTCQGVPAQVFPPRTEWLTGVKHNPSKLHLQAVITTNS